MEILLIERNMNTVEIIQKQLNAEFHIEVTASGEEGLELAKTFDYNLIILSRMLDDSDGYQILKQLRANKIRSPILFLCGLNNADLKVRAFHEGADECMSIPFNVDEFEERAKLLIRHYKGHMGISIQVGRVTLVPQYCAALVDDVPIHLTSKEYDILEILCINKNRMVTKERLLDHLYILKQDYPEMNIIRVFITNLRAKLNRRLGDPFIKTIYAKGFMVEDKD